MANKEFVVKHGLIVGADAQIAGAVTANTITATTFVGDGSSLSGIPSQQSVETAIATKFDASDFNTTFDTNFASKTTSNLTEGSNKYFTTDRARSAVSATGSINYDSTSGVFSFTQGDSDTITEGTTNKYFTTDRARASVSATGSINYNQSTGVFSFTQGNSDTISEGATNKYYTDARARGAVSATGSINYNQSTGVFSFTQGDTDTITEGSTNKYYTDTRARNALSGGTGVTYTASSGVIAIGQNVATTATPTFSGLTVTGNFTVTGTTTTVNSTNLEVTDSLIYLATGNSTNASDIGIVGHFNNGTYQHTGLVRDASDGKWKLFSHALTEPTDIIDFTSVTYDTLKVGTIETGAITGVTTDALSEGTTNLYYTDARARSAAAIAYSATPPASPVVGTQWMNSTTGILYVYVNDGDTTQWIQPTVPVPDLSLYVTTAGLSSALDTALSTKSTTNLAEGTNKYYTDSRARLAISAGSNITYSSSTGVISLTSGNVASALGFTPYSASNPNGYTNNTGTVTSVSGTGTVSGISLSGSVQTSGSLHLTGSLSLMSADVTWALGYTPLNPDMSYVKIGYGATASNSSVAIGYSDTTASPHAIALNATWSQLVASSDGFYVDPIAQASTDYSLHYNPTTKEITYSAGGGGGSVDLSSVSQNIIPSTTDTNSVGSNIKRWKSISLSDSANLSGKTSTIGTVASIYPVTAQAPVTIDNAYLASINPSMYINWGYSPWQGEIGYGIGGGTSVCLRDNAGIRLPTTSALDFGTGDYTIEFWYRPIGGDAYWAMIMDAGNNDQISIGVGWNYGATAGYLSFKPGGDAGNFIQSTTYMGDTNRWYHVACVRSGDWAYLFIDGVLEGQLSGISSWSMCSLSNGVLGHSAYGGGGGGDNYVNANIAYLKISSAALYTTTFSPNAYPAAPDVSTVLLLNFSSRFTLYQDSSPFVSTLQQTPTGRSPLCSNTGPAFVYDPATEIITQTGFSSVREYAFMVVFFGWFYVFDNDGNNAVYTIYNSTAPGTQVKVAGILTTSDNILPQPSYNDGSSQVVMCVGNGIAFQAMLQVDINSNILNSFIINSVSAQEIHLTQNTATAVPANSLITVNNAPYIAKTYTPSQAIINMDTSSVSVSFVAPSSWTMETSPTYVDGINNGKDITFYLSGVWGANPTTNFDTTFVSGFNTNSRIRFTRSDKDQTAYWFECAVKKALSYDWAGFSVVVTVLAQGIGTGPGCDTIGRFFADISTNYYGNWTNTPDKNSLAITLDTQVSRTYLKNPSNDSTYYTYIGSDTLPFTTGDVLGLLGPASITFTSKSYISGSPVEIETPAVSYYPVSNTVTYDLLPPQNLIINSVGSLYTNNANSTAANATGASISLGSNATANNSGVAIGQNASAQYSGTAVGNGAYADNLSIGVGNGVFSGGTFAVAIGYSSYSTSYGVSIGYGSSAGSTGGVAIGRSAVANYNSIALGSFSNVGQGTFAYSIAESSNGTFPNTTWEAQRNTEGYTPIVNAGTYYIGMGAFGTSSTLETNAGYAISIRNYVLNYGAMLYINAKFMLTASPVSSATNWAIMEQKFMVRRTSASGAVTLSMTPIGTMTTVASGGGSAVAGWTPSLGLVQTDSNNLSLVVKITKTNTVPLHVNAIVQANTMMFSASF